MKKLILNFICSVLALFAASYVSDAQASAGDEICGNWLTSYAGSTSYVKISKSSDGTYKAQVYYCSSVTAPDGTKILDVKNPDKSLRNIPIDKVVLFSGLKYDASTKTWSGTKIYDPSRGIKANLTCKLSGNDLTLRGTVLGVGETLIWHRKQ